MGGAAGGGGGGKSPELHQGSPQNYVCLAEFSCSQLGLW